MTSRVTTDFNWDAAKSCIKDFVQDFGTQEKINSKFEEISLTAKKGSYCKVGGGAFALGAVGVFFIAKKFFEQSHLRCVMVTSPFIAIALSFYKYSSVLKEKSTELKKFLLTCQEKLTTICQVVQNTIDTEVYRELFFHQRDGSYADLNSAQTAAANVVNGYFDNSRTIAGVSEEQKKAREIVACIQKDQMNPLQDFMSVKFEGLSLEADVKRRLESIQRLVCGIYFGVSNPKEGAEYQLTLRQNENSNKYELFIGHKSSNSAKDVKF